MQHLQKTVNQESNLWIATAAIFLFSLLYLSFLSQEITRNRIEKKNDSQDRGERSIVVCRTYLEEL